MRLEFLLKHIDNPLFIVIKRDTLENCLSILEARKKNYPNPNKWWSVPISGNLEKKKDLYEQIISQVLVINKDIIFKLKKNKANYIEINYEDILEKPETVIVKVNNFLNNHNIYIKKNFSIAGIKPNLKHSFENEDYLNFKMKIDKVNNKL